VFSVQLYWMPFRTLRLILNAGQFKMLKSCYPAMEGGGFLIEEDFVFPLWFNRYSGCQQWYIPAAQYEFRKEPCGSVTIDFPVQEWQGLARVAKKGEQLGAVV
ncbi:MAG: hypothetical protein AAFR36_29480, partial [Bacteroidota bacterium]